MPPAKRDRESPTHRLPPSIAIAGAWGYIGRKFLDVALARGLTTYVFDPGPAPADVDLSKLIRLNSRPKTSTGSTPTSSTSPFTPSTAASTSFSPDPTRGSILNEKPMAEPERPETCRAVVDAVAASNAVVLYDFPELFDPLTARIVDYLARVPASAPSPGSTSSDRRTARTRITRATASGSSRSSIRNRSTAWRSSSTCSRPSAGGIDAALADGVRVEAESEPYAPPNPEDYPYVVDGRCHYRLTLGEVLVEGLTDFTRGAEWVKRRVIRGVGDGRAFEIDVSYLEGEKSLRIDGVDQPCDPRSSSYEHAIANGWRWSREFDRVRLMSGLFPNPRFTARHLPAFERPLAKRPRRGHRPGIPATAPRLRRRLRGRCPPVRAVQGPSVTQRRRWGSPDL